MSRHRLGFAVKVLGEGGLPSHDSRRWQSNPHLRTSLERLRRDPRPARRATTSACTAWPRRSRRTQAIRTYRSFTLRSWSARDELREIGALARERGIRLSTHPGQYTVLNSEDDSVRAVAVAELEVQAAVLDAMGLPPEAVVVLHVGGAAGGLAAATERFVAGVAQLSDRARARLVVENDDRSFALVDVLPLARRCRAAGRLGRTPPSLPRPRTGSPTTTLSPLALETWPPGVLPKVHYSSPRLDVTERARRRGRRTERSVVLPQLRAHADLIDPIGFEYFLRQAAGGRDFDIMLEAKAKDLALIRLREQLGGRGFGVEGGFVQVRAPG